MSGNEVPILLTVEEAGELLRIGRTKAYAMTREWRETQGRSGLPVVDLGNVLRVPRRAIEDLIGADLSTAMFPSSTNGAIPIGASSETGVNTPTRSTRRPRNRNTDQLDLFDPTTKSDSN